tara:strand:- start:637 stop:777 length:141 start_codon:yes stop_codon:yes gene_type:complete
MKLELEKVIKSKCRCDKYFKSKGYHNNGCKYAIKYNETLINENNNS